MARTITWQGRKLRLKQSRMKDFWSADLVPRSEFYRKFDKRSFRTKTFPDGTRLLIACPQGRWMPRKQWCGVGTRAVELFVPKGQGSNPMYGYNPSRYSVVDAPTSVRRRWARKASLTRLRNLLAACRDEVEAVEVEPEEVPTVTPRILSGVGGPEFSSWERKFVKGFPGKTVRGRTSGSGPQFTEWEREFVKGFPGKTARPRSRNPELLVVNNPGGRRMRRRRKTHRRRARNASLTLRYRGRNRTWRGLVKLIGVKQASKMWRKRRKRFRHGGSSRIRCRMIRRRKSANPRKRRRAQRACRFVRFRGRRRSWRGLVKILGVRGAKKVWHKKKVIARNRGGRKRRSSRRRFR